MWGNEEVPRWPQVWGMVLATMVMFFGYLEQLFATYADAVRAAAIIAFTLIAALACLRHISKIRYFGSFHLLLASLIVYGGAVALLKGDALAAASPVLRLLLLLLISLLAYNLLKWQRVTAERAVAVFLSWCAIFIIAQTVYEVLSGGGIFMNNAVRYYGSISSPIGFASLSFTLLCALGYFWVYQGGMHRFLLLLGLAWVVLMTSTRSISVMAMLVLWLLVAFRLRFKWVGVWLVMTPLLGWGLIATVLEDAGISDRIAKTLSEGGLDGSTSFRIFILENFFASVSLNDLFFGLGLGNFYVWFQKVTEVPNVAPHFEWLWILSEFGLLFFLIYVAYGLAFLCLAYYRWQAGYLIKHEFLGVLLFVSIPQLFLQLANPFYFYQFVIVFGVMAGVALDRCEMATFRILE